MRNMNTWTHTNVTLRINKTTVPARAPTGGDVRQSQMRGRLQSDAKLFRADTKWLNPEGQRPMSVFMKHADSFGVP